KCAARSPLRTSGECRLDFGRRKGYHIYGNTSACAVCRGRSRRPPRAAARMMRGDMEKKLKLGSYVGYGIADLGNNIAFAAVGAYLPAFYSDVLGADFDAATSAVWLTAVTVIMVIARIWDAIN